MKKQSRQVDKRTANLQKDISKKIREEEAFRENERRYRALFEQTTDAVFIVSLEGIHLSVNQKAAEMLGYTIEEFIGMPASQIVAPSEYDQAMDRLAMVQRGETLPIYERNLVHKDGHLVPVEISIALVSDDEGVPLHIQSIIRDITKRKRTESVLQALNMAALAMRNALTPEEIFTAVGDELRNQGLGCTIFSINQDQSHISPIYFNYESKAVAAFEKLLSVKAEIFSISLEAVEVFQKTVWERETIFNEVRTSIGKVFPNRLEGALKQLINMLNIPSAINAPLVVEDQIMGILSVQSNNLTAEEIPAVTAFAHQVAATWHKARLLQNLEESLAEQKRIEDSLRESEDKYRTLFELSPEAIILIGLNGIILDANQAASKIGGPQRQSVIGRSFLDLGLFGEEQMDRYSDLFAKIISGDLEDSLEIEITIPNGGQRCLRIHPALLKKRNEVLALQLIIHDITEAKNAQDAIQQRVAELEALHQTSIQLAKASLSIGEIARIAVQQLSSVLNVDECSFSFLDEENQSLEVIADLWFENGKEYFLDEKEIYHLKDYPVTQQVLENMTPAIIQASDPNAAPSELTYMRKNGTATLAIIPLVIKNHSLGILELETWKERIYTSNELNLATTLANQIAVALDNAGLYEAAQSELHDRIQTEIALQASEEQFRSIFENAVMGIYRSLPNGKIVMANPALVTMLGYDSFNELAKRNLETDGFAGTSPRSSFINMIEAQGQVIGLEATWIRKDGSLLHVRENAKAIYDPPGTVAYYEGTVEDITQRKQIEVAQRIADERFNKAFNISPLAMGIQGLNKDNQQVWLLVNEAFIEIIGYPFEEVVGRSPKDLQLYAHEETNRKIIDIFTEQGFIKEFEFEFRKKSGELRHGMLWAEIIELDNERNALILIQDITDRKQIEQERQNLIEFQQIVAELSTQFINLETKDIETEIEQALQIITDFAVADAASVWMFDAAQSTASKTFGWPAGKISKGTQNVPFDQFPWIFGRILNNENVIISGKDDYPNEAEEFHFLQEKQILKAAFAVPLFSEGMVRGAILIYTRLKEKSWGSDLEPLAKIIGDIILNALDRKQAEDSIHKLNEELETRVIQRTQQLEAANRELEAFSYSVSHDLRAPLRALDGFSLALIEDYGNQLDENASNYLNRIRLASQRMGQLIDDLLKLSRLTRSEMSYEPVNLSNLAFEILAELQETEPQRMVEFNIQPELIVLGDKHLLQIVLVNLISNAWKFTQKKHFSFIEFGCLEEDRSVYFVRDNGAGFDMAYVNKLFGTFQRLHSDSDFEGTGIGLATVKRIIQRHGGKVWAVGQVDKGATFYFAIGESTPNRQ